MTIVKNILFLLFFLMTSNSLYGMNCWEAAGLKYKIDPWLLYSIAQQESALNPRAIGRNRDGSRDIGMMQINSIWLPKLQQMNITEQRLFEPCTNIFVGAWILASSINAMGRNWNAVGAYNAGTKKSLNRDQLRHKYARQVHARYIRNIYRELKQGQGH